MVRERLLRFVFVFACLGACTAPQVHAQSASSAAHSYPNKPVRMIVPYPPGGTSDLVGRLIAQEMGKLLGQSFIIDNRGGAGGMIGTDMVAKAPPDGYTVLVAASGPIAFLPALSNRLPYDMDRDFETIGNLVTVANLMLVHPGNAHFKTLAGLIDYAKRNPDQVKFGSAGIGSSGHIAGELLNMLAGIKMGHVPYRGSGPAMLALMSDQIDVMFENLPSALTQVQGGSLEGVAILSAKRSSLARQFPTTAELGIPKFVIGSSTGLLAPKNTPPEVLAVLEKALHQIANDPAVLKQLAAYGADLDYMDRTAYRNWIHTEVERWSAVGRQANIQID
jgi:tripartite-type tricarboxylate transporter receptor subunit TctC